MKLRIAPNLDPTAPRPASLALRLAEAPECEPAAFARGRTREGGSAP